MKISMGSIIRNHDEWQRIREEFKHRPDLGTREKVWNRFISRTLGATQQNITWVGDVDWIPTTDIWIREVQQVAILRPISAVSPIRTLINRLNITAGDYNIQLDNAGNPNDGAGNPSFDSNTAWFAFGAESHVHKTSLLLPRGIDVAMNGRAYFVDLLLNDAVDFYISIKYISLP